MTAIGIVGCGNIFERYVTALRRFDGIELAWCADINRAVAERRAAELGLPNAGTPNEAAADALGPAALVVNLTPAGAHAEVTCSFLEAGKHVYTEKPLATTLADARKILRLATQRSLLVGAAPDWLLSRSARAARSALESGLIGEPVAASAFISHSRIETWHPDPGAFFLPGAGPVFDMGPYYVSALIHLLGPVRAVAAMETTGRRTRAVTALGRTADSVDVRVPTHTAALVQFDAVVATLTMSFEAWERTMPYIEIYGTEGTLSLPMPHERDDDVKAKRHDDERWTVLELPPGDEYVRGVGVADMARAVAGQRAFACSGALGFQVLEVLRAVETASAERRFVGVAAADELSPSLGTGGSFPRHR